MARLAGTPELPDLPPETGPPIMTAAGGAQSVDGAPKLAATPNAEPAPVAPAEPVATRALDDSSTATGNFFSNMFSSSSKLAAEKKSEGGIIDRTAKVIGLRGSTTRQKSAPAPTSKPKVAEVQAPNPAPSSSNGAIWPKTTAAERPRQAAARGARTASPGCSQRRRGLRLRPDGTGRHIRQPLGGDRRDVDFAGLRPKPPKAFQVRSREPAPIA